MPVSPQYPNRRKRAKTQKQKIARSKAGAVLGSTIQVGQKHRKTPPGALKTQKLKKMTAAIHFTGVTPEGSGVIATRGLCKNQMHHQHTNIIITPHQPPACQNRGEHKRRFQGLHTRTRINLRAAPAMANPWVNPLGSRAQVMKLSFLFRPRQPQNNTPFARRLQYDGALSISASSSTACFAGRLCQFPLEAAPGAYPNRPAGRQTDTQARKHADRPRGFT